MKQIDGYTSLKEKLAEDVVTLTNLTMDQLVVPWADMYLTDPTDVSVLFHKFYFYLSQYYTEIVQIHNDKKEEYKTNISKLKKQLEDVEKESNIKTEIDEIESKPLKVQADLLASKLRQIHGQRTHRSNLSSVHSQRSRSSNSSYSVSATRSEANKIVQNRPKKLERKKTQILESHSKSYSESLLGKLQHVKEGLELSVRAKEVNGLGTLLTTTIENAQTKVEEVKVKLKFLWEHIGNIFEDDYQLEVHERLVEEGIYLVQSEINRFNVIISGCLETSIKAAKLEIEEYWDKMALENQRTECLAYYSDEVSEQRLCSLQQHVIQLQNNYRKHSDVYRVIADWEMLCRKMFYLHQNDKYRLFKNRGGHLLKEEKERKLIEHSLPKVERQLSSLLKEVSDRDGERFLWRGQDLLGSLSNGWLPLRQGNRFLKTALSEANIGTNSNMFLPLQH